MSDKATKAEAHYREGSAKKHCGICTMFRAPRACTAVKGDIRLTGLCDYFKLK